MAERQQKKDPEELRADRLLELGADQLATEIEELLRGNATLISHGLQHRMVQDDLTFEEACVQFGRLCLRLHTGRLLIRTGVDIEKEMEDATVGGAED